MAGINLGRVILGGLVAGLVASLFDVVITTYLLAGDMEAMMQRLNLSPTALQSAVWIFVGVDFLWGILLVFTYAAIRPRFGPGPRAAAIAGVVPWSAMSLLEAQLGAIGVTTFGLYAKGAALYLVSAIASSMAGAALYRE